MKHVLLLVLLCLATAAHAKAKAKAKPKPKPPAATSQRPAEPRPVQTAAVVMVDAPPPMQAVLLKSFSGPYETLPVATPMSDAPTTKEVREASSAAGAIAVLHARQKGKAWVVYVLSAVDGSPIDTQTVPVAKKPVTSLPKQVQGAVLVSLAELKRGTVTEAKPAEPKTVADPTPSATPTPTPTPSKSVASEPTTKPASSTTTSSEPPASSASSSESSSSTPAPATGPKLPALQLSLGVFVVNRTFNYVGDAAHVLLDYRTSPVAPAMRVETQWYPGAHLTTGLPSYFGLMGLVDSMVGLTSGGKNNTRFQTSSERLRLAAAFRAPLGEALSIGITAGVSSQSFLIAPFSVETFAPRPNVIGVTFVGPRFSAGVRYEVSPIVFVDGTLGFIIATTLGELSSAAYFPKASAFGLDVNAGVGLKFTDNFFARVAFDFTRYFATLNPSADTPSPATAAADQYVGGVASVGVLF